VVDRRRRQLHPTTRRESAGQLGRPYQALNCLCSTMRAQEHGKHAGSWAGPFRCPADLTNAVVGKLAASPVTTCSTCLAVVSVPDV